MNSSYDWNKYNYKINNLALKIHNYNLRSKFNFIENNHYNHIRDIYALSLLLLRKKKNKKNTVLDYGGNLIAHSNLINKINIKDFKFYIYNPFSQIEKKKLHFKYEFLKDINYLYNKKFDLLYFGSSLQYLENFSILESLNFFQKCNYVLITHTPISFNLKSKLVIKQQNHKNLYQNIYSMKYIEKKLLKNQFQLIFMSLNDHKYSGLKKKYKNIHSVNVLFKKKN